MQTTTEKPPVHSRNVNPLKTISCVPFRPAASPRFQHLDLSPVPNTLYRAYTAKSYGSTNSHVALSRDAVARRPHAVEDVFQTCDVASTARGIARHLKNKYLAQDNFLSWTSSLLFALQGILYRHHAWHDGSALKDIRICVIDTTQFPSGTFIRDMDLIDAFCAESKDLAELKDQRTRKDGTYNFNEYFGEYLSQGYLNIENKCKVINAQDLFNRGLASLRPQFDPLDRDQVQWVRKVEPIRNALSKCENSPWPVDPIDPNQADTALKIAELFGVEWRLPIAINLLALLKGRLHATTIENILIEHGFNDDELLKCARMNVMPYDGMPELHRVEKIRLFIHEFLSRRKTEELLREGVASLRRAKMYMSGTAGLTDHDRSEWLRLVQQAQSFAGSLGRSIGEVGEVSKIEQPRM